MNSMLFIVVILAACIYGGIAGIASVVIVENKGVSIWKALVWSLFTWPIVATFKIIMAVFDYLLARLS